MLCFCSCDLCTSLAPGIRDPLLPSLKSWKRLSFPGHNPVWMCPSSRPDWDWDSHLHGQWDLEQHSSVQGWVTHFYPHQKNIPEIIHTKLNEQHYLNFFFTTVTANTQHNYSAVEFCNHSGSWFKEIANPWHATWDWQNICCRCKGYVNKPCWTWCTLGNLSMASSVQPKFDTKCSDSPKKQSTLPSVLKTSLLLVKLHHV